MNRKETTEFLGQLLISTRFGGAGKHWASEVSIDPWGREAKRVDYMQFSPADQCSISGIEKGIFTCYEVKSCKEDVYSGVNVNIKMYKKWKIKMYIFFSVLSFSSFQKSSFIFQTI